MYHKIILADIDNKDVSLKNLLQEYSPQEIISVKNDFSNDKVKYIVRDYLINKSMDEKLRRSIKYENIMYKLLKMDYRNYEKM